jgi:hypothetical protein
MRHAPPAALRILFGRNTVVMGGSIATGSEAEVGTIFVVRLRAAGP